MNQDEFKKDMAEVFARHGLPYGLVVYPHDGSLIVSGWAVSVELLPIAAAVQDALDDAMEDAVEAIREMGDSN